MHKVHLYAELFVQVFGQVLCRIYGAMLPACAAEAYGETGEAAFHVSLYGSIYQSVYVFKENGYFPVFFEETDNGFVKSGERLIAFVLAGIVYGAAVEYKAAAIAGGVFGDSFLIGKAGDFHYQAPLLQVVGELFQFGQFVQDFAEVGVFGVRFLQQLAQVFNGERHTLDEVGLLLEVTAKTVCASSLHGAEQYEVTKLGIEITFVHRLVFTQRFYILFQKLLTQAVGIIGFGLP